MSAQTSAPAEKPSSVAGIVMKEPGSEPLKKVLVQFIAEDQKIGGNYTASTDADGHFHIDNVVPGRYRLYLEKTGLVKINSHGAKSDLSVFTIQAGQSLEDLQLRMLPTAIITGRVTDEDGDPMSNVRVIVQRKKPGKASRETVGGEPTNDLGEYRVAGLFPGQYWVVAMPPPDFRDYDQPHQTSSPDTLRNDAQSEAQPDTRYRTTYYPGTYDATQASTITLKAGDEMPANFTLIPSRTYRVRGVVTGITSSDKPVVELIPRAGDAMHANEIEPDGQFELRGVGPGAYVIRASAGADSHTLTAQQDLTVVAADIEGVKLTPMAAFKISGHLYAERNAPADLTQYSVNLRSAESPEDSSLFPSQEFFGVNAAVDRFGNFEWKSVNPGNYIVQVYGGDGHGLFMKSVRLGGSDVETGFTVSGSATLDVIISLKGAVIEGMVVEKEKDVDDDHPVPNATVVAVPEEKFRKLPDHFVTGSSDQHGRFIIRGLPPGIYRFYAWQDIEDGVYRDADFLKTQESTGVAVKIEEGTSQAVRLKLSSVPEEWR
jgi:hypothetical protein